MDLDSWAVRPTIEEIEFYCLIHEGCSLECCAVSVMLLQSLYV